MQCQFILGLIHVFDKKDIVCRHKNINKKAKVCNKERQEKNLSIHLFSFVDTFSRFKNNYKKTLLKLYGMIQGGKNVGSCWHSGQPYGVNLLLTNLVM